MEARLKDELVYIHSHCVFANAAVLHFDCRSSAFSNSACQPGRMDTCWRQKSWKKRNMRTHRVAGWVRVLSWAHSLVSKPLALGRDWAGRSSTLPPWDLEIAFSPGRQEGWVFTSNTKHTSLVITVLSKISIAGLFPDMWKNMNNLGYLIVWLWKLKWNEAPLTESTSVHQLPLSVQDQPGVDLISQ